MKNFDSEYLKKELIKMFDGYELTSKPKDEKLFFVKKLAPANFRDKNKALIKTGVRCVFVNPEMYKRPEYKGENENFRYLIIYTLAKKRDYRCKHFYDFEHEKIFVSGKSDREIIQQLKTISNI